MREKKMLCRVKVPSISGYKPIILVESPKLCQCGSSYAMPGRIAVRAQRLLDKGQPNLLAVHHDSNVALWCSSCGEFLCFVDDTELEIIGLSTSMIPTFFREIDVDFD